MMADLEVLLALKELFSERGKWTQGELARNSTHDPVDPLSDDAVCFCIEGGLCKVNSLSANGYVQIPDFPGMQPLQKAAGCNQLWQFNDSISCGDMTYERLMATIDKAIESEKEKILLSQ